MIRPDVQDGAGLAVVAQAVGGAEQGAWLDVQAFDVEAGAVGEFVFSTLRREAQPLFRYRTSDLAEILSAETGEDGLKRMRFRIRGRTDQMLVVKQKVVEHAVGELRDYEKEPASLEFGNLVVTLAESHADSWYQWFDDFVVKGNCGQDKEKSGSLAYLTPDLKTELFKVTFSNLGIFRLTEDHVEAGSEGIRRVKAELYVEKMAFAPKGAATG